MGYACHKRGIIIGFNSINLFGIEKIILAYSKFLGSIYKLVEQIEFYEHLDAITRLDRFTLLTN